MLKLIPANPNNGNRVHIDNISNRQYGVCMEYQTQFGRWLRDSRHTAGMTIAELAEQVGMSASYMRILETRLARPSELLAVKIAELLGVNAEEVVFMARGWPERLEDVRKRFPTASKRYFT